MLLEINSAVSSAAAAGNIIASNNATAKPLGSIKSDLDALTRNKHVMVFSGFSGLGYSNLEGMKEKLSAVLEQAIKLHGVNNLCVTAGATPEGIGMVYEIAHKKNIATLGIVSEQAKDCAPASMFCQDVIYVPDPGSSWKVLDETNHSYMVYVATQKDDISRTGEFLAFGGGAVTLSELQEAEKSGLKTTVHPEFEPSPEQVAKRRLKEPDADLTPVRSVYQHQHAV